eukprot:1484946-Rhodomonas_salina.1
MPSPLPSYALPMPFPLPSYAFSATSLRPSYAISATSLRASYEMPGADIAYGSPRERSLIFAAADMNLQVVTTYLQVWV